MHLCSDVCVVCGQVLYITFIRMCYLPVLSLSHLQIELDTAQSMQTLVDLDRVKTRMQESADALQVGSGCCGGQDSVQSLEWSIRIYVM